MKDCAIKMLCYSVNSLDALDKLKEANCYAYKKEASKKALKALVSNPFDFSLPAKLNLKTLAFLEF